MKMSQRQHHQIAHVARPGRADENAVIGEREDAEHRGEHDQPQIIACAVTNVGACSHDIDQRGTEQREDGSHRERKGESPQDDQPRCAGEGGAVARAVSTAAKLFGGVGKAVEKEGADQQKIVQHRIGGERHVAGARALGGEEQPYRDQRRGADHDVAVDQHHAHQLGAVEQRRARNRKPACDMPRDQSTDHESNRFGNDRGHRRTCDPGIEHQHQQDRRRHVDDVDRDLHAERQCRAGLPDQPAEHDIIGQHQRRGPDADREVGLRGARDALAAAHRAEQPGGQRYLQHNETCADQSGDNKAPHQQRAQFLRLHRRRGPGQ